jgi:hypothetical protein
MPVSCRRRPSYWPTVLSIPETSVLSIPKGHGYPGDHQWGHGYPGDHQEGHGYLGYQEGHGYLGYQEGHGYLGYQDRGVPYPSGRRPDPDARRRPCPKHQIPRVQGNRILRRGRERA